MSYTVTITPTAYDASIDNTTYTVSIGNSVQPISSFLDLLDVDPTTYSGSAGYYVVVNSGEDGLELSASGGGGASQLSDLSDVNTSTATNRNVLVADGVDWESRALTEADISDLGTYLTDITGENLQDLSNVTITTLGADELLFTQDGTTWVNQTLAEAGISAVGHSHTASDVSDFDTEVANNSAVALNTAKVTNATHTGQVTGSGALTAQPEIISDQTLVTAVGSDSVLILDATDGQLKKALISDFASAGGDMAASTYDPAGISEQLVGLTATQTLTNKTLTSPTINGLGGNLNAGANDISVDAGQKFILDGSGGDTYLLFNAATGKLELWVQGVKKMQWG